MEKRALLGLLITCVMLVVGPVSAQESETEAGAQEPSAEETPPAEEAPAAEETPAPEEAPAPEGAAAEEAPVEETTAEEAATVESAAEEAPAEEASVEETGEEAEGNEEDEEEEEGDEGDEEKPFRRPFAGSSFYWSNEFTAISLDKEHDYTYNPVYSMGFGVAPVWNVSPMFSLSTNIGFNTELTNSDFSNKRGEVFFGDIPIMGSFRYSVDVNDDVKFGTGLSLSVLIPTSKMSRYFTLYTALGVGTKAGFTFSKVLEGLTIAWKPKFTKFFHASENAVKEGNPLDESGIPESEKMTSEQYQSVLYGGSENPSWSISNGLSINLNIVESLSFSFGYTHSYTYKYAATNADDDLGSESDPMGREGSVIRDTGYSERGTYNNMFSYDLSYTLPEPAHMLTLSIGALTASNQLGPDGSYRTPFFNRETLITFGLSLDIDATVTAVRGEDEE